MILLTLIGGLFLIAVVLTLAGEEYVPLALAAGGLALVLLLLGLEGDRNAGTRTPDEAESERQNALKKDLSGGTPWGRG